MRNCTLLLVLLASGAGALLAQDISGDWQGTIKTGDRETGRYRYLLHIVKEKNGKWSGTVRQIDQRIDWGGLRPVSSLSLAGADFKFMIEQPDGSYEGKVSADLSSIVGTWKQGQSQQLEFVRPTKETVWRDDPRHTAQLITVDKDVKLEVLDWGGSGRSLVLLTCLGTSLINSLRSWSRIIMYIEFLAAALARPAIQNRDTKRIEWETMSWPSLTRLS
jgi:hypothetical protein